MSGQNFTKVTLLTGGMFSGKTRRLVDELEKRVLAHKSVLYVHPFKDTRENKSHQSFVSKHLDELINDNLVDIIEVNDISEVTKYLSETSTKYSSVFIDEYFMIKFQNIESFLNKVHELEIPDIYLRKQKMYYLMQMRSLKQMQFVWTVALLLTIHIL